MQTDFDRSQAPVAEQIPHETVIHGETRVDNYFWLRESENPKVIGYLNAENDFTASYMASTEDLQKDLYDELVTYLVEDDQSVPRFKDGYWYYTRSEKGKNYAIYCRREGTMEAPEQIILDLNALAEGRDYLNVGTFEVSPDQNILAYSLDYDGSEAYTVFFKDLNTGELHKDTLTNTYYDFEWSADSKQVFYTTIDEAHRPYKLYRHVLGNDQVADVEVHHEPDERFNVGVYKTSSEDYIIINLHSNTTTENLYIPSHEPEAEPVLIQERVQHHQYSVEHHGEDFIVHTNWDAADFRVMRTPLITPSRDHWKEMIPVKKDAKLESVQVFAHHMALLYRTDARMQLMSYDLHSQKTQEVTFPDAVASVWPGAVMDFNTSVLRVSYASLVTPWSVFEVNLATHELTLKKQNPINGYNPEDYTMKREYATAPDGTKVPLTLVYKNDFVQDGTRPAFLYSYGSYGISTDPDFDSTVIALLKRGFVYAVAHIRGGQEMGRQWYDNGKLENKKNTFIDFIACAEHLVNEKYTNPEQLVIEGGSAGGLLMGAVTNMRPDLFCSVIADVPFVDCVNTMLDASLPLTVTEYEEWGNPNEKPYYDYIKSYSPYDNVSAQAYPHMLVLGGLHDPRVKYWEPAKLVAKLRTQTTSDRPILLKTNMSAGHSGASGRYDALKEQAFKYAFMLKSMSLV